MSATVLDPAAVELDGSLLDLTVPAPGKGLEWLTTVPAGHVWRVLLGQVIFRTSAEAQSRQPMVVIRDGDKRARYFGGWEVNMAGGRFLQVSYDRSVTSGQNTGANTMTAALPDLWLPAGWTIGSNTSGIKAGDEYEAVALLIEQAFDTSPGEAPGFEHHRNGHDALGWWTHAA